MKNIDINKQAFIQFASINHAILKEQQISQNVIHKYFHKNNN